MKKILPLFLFISLAVFVFSNFVQAQSGITGSRTDSQGSKTSGNQSVNFKENISTVDSITSLLTSIQSYLNATAATIAVIFIMIGAIFYIAASFGKEDLAALGKKIVIVTTGGFALVVAAPVFWKEITSIIPGGDASSVATTKGMAEIIGSIVSGFLGFVGLYAILGFLFGGFSYFFALGDEKKMERAKTSVQYSVIGVVVAVGAIIIVNQIVSFLSATS